MPARDELVAVLRERLTRFERLGERAAVLDDEATAAAAALLRQARQQARTTGLAADDEALGVLTRLYYYRRRFLPLGSDEHDLEVVYGLQRDARPLARPSERPGGKPPERPGERLSTSDLSLQLYMFITTGEPRALDQAVTSARHAVDRLPDRHPDRAACLALLSVALRTRFEHRGDTDDLTSAVAAGQEAVARTRRHHYERPQRLCNLALALHARFRATGDPAALDEAIVALRQAVASTARRIRYRTDDATYLSHLGIALLSRFRAGGETSVLDEAIRCHQAALADTPLGWPGRPRYAARLGVALRLRYEQLGDVNDLDAAAAICRDAADAVPDGHPDRAEHLFQLGLALLASFADNDRIATLNEAITCLRRAVDVTAAGHVDLAGRLSRLGTALLTRYERVGDAADLDAAVAAGRKATTGSVAGRPEHPVYLCRLATALRIMFVDRGAATDLDEAIQVAQAARAAVPDGHPDSAEICTELGLARYARFVADGGEATTADDLTEAIGAWQQGYAVQAAPAHARITAARTWGEAAADADDHPLAAAGFAAAVRLLPRLVWHGLDRPTRAQHLADSSDLVRDAAACAIHAGQPEQAVELLELGRSVLWTQALNLRTDLTTTDRAAARLARRLATVSRALDASASVLDSVDGPQARRAAEDRMRLAREWDELVERIRALPGLAHFLAPAPYADLRRCAAAGPVALVNVSRYGCHALIVRRDEEYPLVLPLRMTEAEAADRANAWLDARTRVENGDHGLTAEIHLRNALRATLTWLWQAVAEPVLSACGYHAAPDAEAATRRLWWCPTGPLALLPLHAAGSYTGDPERTDTVLDRVVPSYTPTLAALVRLRERTASPRRWAIGRSRPRLLAVGLAHTPGAASLPAVRSELDTLARIRPVRTRLVDSHATVDRVRRALARHQWVHFACHGNQDVIDPARSAVHLHDGPLTVAQIAALRLRRADLAFLSACHAAAGDIGLVDEAVHLAGALHVAGYRHVIATQWFISDTHAPRVTEDVYRALGYRRHAADHAAEALSRAVRAFRVRSPGEPELWAAYLHIGP